MNADGRPQERLIAWGGGLLLVALAGWLSYWLFFRIYDQHRVVTRRMGWHCIGVRNTADPKLPRVESATFWFYDNPHFEELASGPSLCAALGRVPDANVQMTFDTWGNSRLGLHGYEILKLQVNGTPVMLYGTECGGFHDDEPHVGSFDSREDKRRDPAKYHFPIDTFRP